MSCGWRIGSCLCSSRNKDDPQLFTITPTKQTREDFQTALAARLGHFPPTPDTGFIGRSRDLLALQRLLFPAPVTGKELVEQGFRYAVVRGQGGEGKTALAAEFARWLVRSQQIRRAAFVSVEGMEKNLVESVLDTLYESQGGPLGVGKPLMTLWHGGDGSQKHVFSGFQLWYWRREQQIAIADWVLQTVWGIPRQNVPR